MHRDDKRYFVIVKDLLRLATQMRRVRHVPVSDHSNIGIMGSKPAQGMAVCLRFFCVLCCPMQE